MVKMHLRSIFFLGLLQFAASVYASPLGDSDEPAVLATAAFPEDNIFGHVVNGEKNRLEVFIENTSDKNVTLLSIAGSVHHPETNALIKNTSALTYGVRLVEGTKIQLPYTFYSEFKPGDLKLNIWLEHVADDKVYRVTAYDSIITVVEPEMSWFDLKMLSTYAIVAGMLGALGYFAYQTYAPAPKKTRKPRDAKISTPVGTVTATGAGGYQEEWIPEHHLKKSKTRKGGAASSGDELSGGETSGTDSRRRKGRK